MDALIFVLEALVVLGAIIMGTRAGGVGVGLWGGLGVAVLVFVFQEPPGDPPGSAMLIILAVVTAAAMMQAAGGIDWMVAVAARVIERHPRQITIVAPLVTFFILYRCGNGEHHLPAAARDLRRVLSQPHPTLATVDRDRRPVRYGFGRLASLCGHGGDAHPDRRRAVQPGVGADPVDHAAGQHYRHRRDGHRGQPDVEGAR